MNKKSLSNISTIMGLVVAIANAWITIDFSTFDIKRDWPKLALSAIIAFGGWITQIKSKDTPYKYD